MKDEDESNKLGGKKMGYTVASSASSAAAAVVVVVVVAVAVAVCSVHKGFAG